MYLEVLGNILVTEDTHAWIRKTSAKLLDALRKREEKQMFQSCWDFSLLKDKELDVMEGVFARWKSGSEGERSIVDCWLDRQRTFLGGRWEGREGVAEMDYHMHLVERGGAAINKRDFLRWRDSGLAFRVTEDDSLTSNVTLLSGDSPGYWGDVMTGPFVSYSEILPAWRTSINTLYLVAEQKFDWSLQDSNNVNNVEDCSETISLLEDIIEALDSNGVMAVTKILPLSLSASSRLERTLKSGGCLDTVWVGLSMTHLINETFSRIVSGSGQLVMETPLYLLVLTKQILQSFKTKAQEICTSSGFTCEDLEYDVIKTFSIKMVPEKTNKESIPE